MTKEAIIKKVEKLLRLSESPNEHEAALAASRAKDLMEKYQIEAFDLKEDDPKSSLGITENSIYSRSKSEDWLKIFFCNLARAYDCKPYFTRGGGISLHAIGMKTDLDLLKVTFSYLLKVVDFHYKKAKVKRRKAERVRISRKEAYHFRRGFCFGMTDRIVSRIEKEKAERLQKTVEVKDLVVVKEDAIKEYTKDWNWSKARNLKKSGSSDGYSTGWHKGGMVGISAPGGEIRA